MTDYFVRIWAAPLLLLLSSPLAHGDIFLDFEGLDLVDGTPIPQSYGDNFQIDVSYRQLVGFGNESTNNSDLYFWSTGYGDLENVVWGSPSGPDLVGEIRFDSLSVIPLRLNSFDAADWDSTANSQTFRVYDENYSLLFELANFDVTHVTRDSITPNVSANTLILQWDNPWAVAIDNISITTVPEPNSAAILAIAFATMSLRRRRVAFDRNHVQKKQA